MGLNKYGKGDWRSISRYYVISKTPMQVASHAQKYFRRQNSSTPVDRRRPSIHDIQTVTPTPTRALDPAPLPAYPSVELTPSPPMNINTNPMFMNMNIGDSATNVAAMGMNDVVYPYADDYFNQNFAANPAAAGTSATVYPSYIVPPSYMNQQYWGWIQDC